MNRNKIKILFTLALFLSLIVLPAFFASAATPADTDFAFPPGYDETGPSTEYTGVGSGFGNPDPFPGAGSGGATAGSFSSTSSFATCKFDADSNGRKDLSDLLNYATCLISGSVIPLIFALALAAFVWGVVQYVIGADNEEKRAQGRQFMIYGIIALTVMVSVWGLVSIVGGTFEIKNVIPTLPEKAAK